MAYLNQYPPSSLLSYVISRGQWVKIMWSVLSFKKTANMLKQMLMNTIINTFCVIKGVKCGSEGIGW